MSSRAVVTRLSRPLSFIFRGASDAKLFPSWQSCFSYSSYLRPVQQIPPVDYDGVDVILEQTSLQRYILYKTRCNGVRKHIQDAFCVVDLGRIVDVHEKWTTSLPGIQPYYAVKCNDNAMVLKTLASLGTGFDCSSKNEIQMILDLNVCPDRIIFANPCKPVSHLMYAAANGVKCMTFDNESELRKIKQHFPGARLVLRILSECTDAIFPLGSKFGCTMSDALTLLQAAKSMDLNVVGVSFHVGTLSQSPSSYHQAIKRSREVFHYATEIGFHMDLLNIGGGYPGRNDDKSNEMFEKITLEVKRGLELFSDCNNLNVISEPGLFYPCSSFAVVVNITSKRYVKTQNQEEPVIMYYVNDGVYGLFNCALFTKFSKMILHPEVIKEVSVEAPRYKTILWGPTCDSLDKIGECEMPELEVGDWILFDGMGAYSYTCSTSFNSFEKPVLYYYTRESRRDIISSMLLDAKQF